VVLQSFVLALCLSAEPAAPVAPPPSLDAGGFRTRPTPLTKDKARLLRVGVPEPRVLGKVSPREAAILAQALVTEVRKVDGLTAVGIAEIREVLTQEYRRQMMGCQANQECLAEIAGALGVDELVTSELVVDGDSSTFTVSRVEMRTTRVKADAHRRLRRSHSGEEVLGYVGEAVATLFPDRPLREGQTRGVAKQAARWLNPPPIPRWVFFTTAGAAAVVAAGGTAYGLASNATRAQYNGLATSPAPSSGAELLRLHQQAVDQSTRATVLFGVAGGFAVAAAVEAFFTDWHNDRAAVTVTPAGATLNVRF
jgi:hypothetical protein